MTRFLHHHMTRLTLASAVCLGVLAGCDSRDPYKRDDVWYPTGSNAANLAAQVADPHDLMRGQNDPRQLADTPARAIARVRSDSAKPLTGGSAASGGGSGSSGGGGGGAASSATDTPTIPTMPSMPSIPGLGGG